MDIVIPKNIEQLRFLVVDEQGYIISAHQHPDAADRFLRGAARKDLRTAMLPEGVQLTMQVS